MKTHFATLCFGALFLLNSAEAQYNCYNDYEPPIPICDGHTVISLGSDGKATLYASVLDDGSYDNCGIAEFKVARMFEGPCPYGVIDDTQFRAFTQFCCEDIGYPIWVILRVFDYAGNYNDCMVEVTVQDKLPPSLHCPYGVTINCDYWFNYNDLYNPYSTTFGSPVVYDNCGLELVYVNVIDNTSCGLGTIQRVFTAIDWGGQSATCYQNVYIHDSNPFGPWDINWPWDYTADGCSVVDTDPNSLPGGYGRPTWNDNSCSLIGAAYDDKVFEFVDGVCTKIIRTWTVVDWCQFNPYNPYYGGIWEHIQIIKLIDHDKPQFGACNDITVEGVENTCAGRLVHDPQIYDHCTPNEKLNYEYKVDIYANGSHDIIRKGYPTVDEVLPVGTHKVLWFVDDGCGNLSSCAYYVTVVDAKAPTPVCFAQLSTVVMPQGGMITIWARDFDASSFDNCTAPAYLKFSFSPDYTQGSYTFTCDDVGMNMLKVYVTDAVGNQAYCNTHLQIDDNEGVCESMNVISGEVNTFSGTAVADAEVVLLKVMPNQTMETDLVRMSDAEGEYQVGFGTTQFDRMVKVGKSGNPLEGISTLDLVYLQQHIMGIAPIVQDEALYAADIDDSGHIGVNDLILLRDAFLSNGKSLQGATLPWLIYPEECTWIDGKLDVECSVLVEVDHTAPPLGPVNFRAVKKGDINGDVLTEITTHGSYGLDLGIITTPVSGGSDLQFVVLQDVLVSGFQISLSSGLFSKQNVSIVSGQLSMSGQNYYVDAELNSLNMAWIGSVPKQLTEGEVLFTVKLRYDRVSNLENAVRFKGVYQDQMYSQDRQAWPVSLRWLNSVNVDIDNTTFEHLTESVEQPQFMDLVRTTEIFGEINVWPNPMTVSTRIQFESDAAVVGQFEVYSSDLRQIMRQKLDIVQGINVVVLRADQLNGTGIYYFKIKSADQTFTGKIVHID